MTIDILNDKGQWVLNAVNPSGGLDNVLRRARLFTNVCDWRVNDSPEAESIKDSIIREHAAFIELRKLSQSHGLNSQLGATLHTLLIHLMEDGAILLTHPKQEYKRLYPSISWKNIRATIGG